MNYRDKVTQSERWGDWVKMEESRWGREDGQAESKGKQSA